MNKREFYEQEAKKLRESTGLSSVSWWKPDVGGNLIRILPNKHFSEDPEAVFFKKLLVHWGVGPDNIRVTCRKTLGEEENCPICAYVQELRDSGNPEDGSLADRMEAQTRFVMNIIDVNDVSKGIQAFEASKGLFGAIIPYFYDPEWYDEKDPHSGLDSLTKGHNITINRVGTGMRDTRYTVVPSPKVSPVKPSVMEKVMDFDTYYKISSEEELVAILRGEAFEEEGDEEEASQVENPFVSVEESEDISDSEKEESADPLDIPMPEPPPSPKKADTSGKFPAPKSRAEQLKALRGVRGKGK